MQKDDIIISTLRKIEEHISDIDRDMEKDRQNLQDLNIRLSGVETRLEELRKAINQNSERIKDKVHDVVEGVVESTNRLTTQIKDKKMVYLKEKRGWFSKLFKK